MDPATSVMKNSFETSLSEILAKKYHNSQIFTKEAYMEMINTIEKIKLMSRGKKPADYCRLRRYGVVVENGLKRLVFPPKKGEVDKERIYYVHTEEMFELLHECHLASNHGGRNRMAQYLKNYKNLTREVITLYITFCGECKKKRNPFPAAGSNAPRTRKPQLLIRKSFFDFVDMNDENEYKFLFIHEDCDTGFIQLRPSKTKTVEEASKLLVELYSTFGPSVVLKCSMGRNFYEQLVLELRKTPQFKLIDFEYNDSAETEDYNKKTITMVTTEISQNTKKLPWVDILSRVQYTCNKTFNSKINTTPFDAMFNKFDHDLNNTKPVIGDKRSYVDRTPLKIQIKKSCTIEDSDESQNSPRLCDSDSELCNDGMEAADNEIPLGLEESISVKTEVNWEDEEDTPSVNESENQQPSPYFCNVKEEDIDEDVDLRQVKLEIDSPELDI